MSDTEERDANNANEPATEASDAEASDAEEAKPRKKKKAESADSKGAAKGSEAKGSETKSAAKGAAKDPASWGFLHFAKDFPAHAELDALVFAFSNGDYAAVRTGAPKLAASTDDEAVKRAANLLRARIEPDPTAKLLFLFAAALLLFLTGWWVAHDGPEGTTTPPPKVVPKVEHVD